MGTDNLQRKGGARLRKRGTGCGKWGYGWDGGLGSSGELVLQQGVQGWIFVGAELGSSKGGI